MKPVARHEILDHVTYNERRPVIRSEMMKLKDLRRVHLGEYLTLLFENRDTVRYQIQEMIRAEQMVRESDIVHEIATYNELLGGPGEMGSTLLIEIDDPDRRAILLSEWLDLPKHVYVRLDNGEKVYSSYDPRQIGTTRLSSVQYLKFDTKGRVPVAAGTDFPPLSGEVELTEAQREALARDLKD